MARCSAGPQATSCAAKARAGRELCSSGCASARIRCRLGVRRLRCTPSC